MSDEGRRVTVTYECGTGGMIHKDSGTLSHGCSLGDGMIDLLMASGRVRRINPRFVVSIDFTD